MAAKKAKRKTPARATSASSSPRKRGSSKPGGSTKLDSRIRGNDGKAQTASLLVELLTEELPPKSLKRLSEAFAQQVTEGLRTAGFLAPDTSATPFATPRRLAVRITHVLGKQPDRIVERRGPAVATALDAQGKPTPALVGFARSCGVEVEKLERQTFEKGEHFVFRSKQKGEPLASHLAGIVEASLKKLPVAKLMRWGAGDAEFVRPVHGVIMLHGTKVVAGKVLGLEASGKTLGHRFLSKAKGPIVISSADQYESVLEAKGAVVVDFAVRRSRIVAQLKRKAGKAYVSMTGFENSTGDAAAAAWILQGNDNLLDEVTAIVEWPSVYEGQFDPKFLALPAQCIGTTMQKNQKYFALVDQSAKLLPRYLIVSNIDTKAPAQIVSGNARVLRARLADANFFFDQDRKTKLSDRVPHLGNVVYHNKLGSQLDRVRRIQALATSIAAELGFKQILSSVEQAAKLCKADLLTDMVGEFPELQGLMGFYYAQHDGETVQVAGGIREHYLPRFAQDVLPRGQEGICLALADKLETLVGIYGIGLVPTGDKDPYGLRRAALGVVRILVEKELPLDLPTTLKSAAALFDGKVGDKVAVDVYGFMLDRLRSYLRDRGFKPDEIEAVLALTPARLDQIVPRLTALQHFRRLPEAAALAAANKRIRNILRQAGGGAGNGIDASLLREDAERTLAAAVVSQREAVTPLLAAGDYTGALKRLAQLREPVDVFFDKVMVMAEDEALKRNRLALLHDLSELFLGAADIARLQE